MRRFGLLASIAVLLCAAPLAANAQRAWAINGADIFAGPGTDYPVVAHLAPGVGLRINGCLGDYQWCDVSFGPNRGWAYAGDLGYAYQSSRVPVIEYGPRLALPVITFSLGNYWDRYYRSRPWYHERGTWERHWNDHRHEYHNEWRGNNNEWRGNNNWQGHDRNNHDNDRHREYRQENRVIEQPHQNYEGRRNESRVNGSVQNDGRGGYAPARPGPNGTTAPTTPTPSTPGYYTGQQ